MTLTRHLFCVKSRPFCLPKNPIYLNLLLALILSAAYFFFIKGFAGHTVDAHIFVSRTTTLWIPQQAAWEGRLGGTLMTGWMFDFLVHHTAGSYTSFYFIFGLYQGVWLFLLLLLLIFSAREAWLINLGIFAGLLYNFFPGCNLCAYPWDIPGTFFFTLATLLFMRRNYWLMLAVICAGCLFKETVLVCALLFFFITEWKWSRRVLTFFGTVAVYAISKKMLKTGLGLQAAALSMNNAENSH